MKILRYIFWFLFVTACSPKTTIPAPADAAVQPATPAVDMSNLSPCPNWLTLSNSDDISNEYFIYRDAIKASNYKKAFEGWKKVFAVAPAADGKRSTVFDDGIRIYTKFFEQETDTAKKREYVKKVLDLYEQSGTCYPTGANVDAQKAFQYYYSFPGYASDEQIFSLFRKALDKDGDKADYFILNPFTALLIQQFIAGNITMGDAQRYTKQVKTILNNGLNNCKTVKECEPWKIINDYVPARLDDLEGVEGFYDCAYYKDKYFKDFQAAPNDCEVINTVFGRLRWAKCPDVDNAIVELRAAKAQNCKVAIVETKVTSVGLAIDALNDGNYKLAIELLKKAVDETDDHNRKAELNMHIAATYYRNLRNYAEARRYALQAAGYRPNYGDPYMMIGDLYASSGPLCGPGRGYESQQVVWVAIDKWEYAKRIDPSVTTEANKKINQYIQYMPSKEDLHMRSITQGTPIKVGCWINETTTARAVN
ncbi:MAG: tetratricopeptide repeat protein [Saprospiraceae bacterium]